MVDKDKSENKFSVGDKVKCVEADKFTEVYGLQKGETYTISLVNDSGYVGLAEHNHTQPEWAVDRFELVKQKEKEMTFKNMKFDVAAIAKQLNVKHEEASRIIQEALFEQGYKWASGLSDVLHQDAEGIYTYNSGEMRANWSGTGFHSHENKEHCIKQTYTIVEAEEQQEIVELNGKKYNKQELERALSLLKPIE